MARRLRKKYLGTRPIDYPSGMSQYERESLAAEAKLAEDKKKRPRKKKPARVTTTRH